MASNPIIDEFIRGYDALINDWLESAPSIKGNPFFKNISKLELHGMPEPYFGDPYKCSAVIININPGQTIDTNDRGYAAIQGNVMNYYKLSTSNPYSKIACKFPYLDSDYYSAPAYKAMVKTMAAKKQISSEKKDSASWWKLRDKWINNLPDIANATSTPKPFAIELCPWHSKQWDNQDTSVWNNDDLKNHIKKNVIEPACEVIKLKYSILPFGLIIGKAVCDAVMAIDNSWEFIETWNQDNWDEDNGKWPLKYVEVEEWSEIKQKNIKVKVKDEITGKYKKERRNRTYALMCNKTRSTFFLCTWTQAANCAPAKDFKTVEKHICQEIKKHIQER